MAYLHPAMWHVALESWQWIEKWSLVLWRHWLELKWAIIADFGHLGLSVLPLFISYPPYWNSTSGFDFDHTTAVDMSLCTSLCEILPKLDHPWQKKMTSCRLSRWRISAIFDFRGSIIGSLKSPCTSSYRSSIETMPINCLIFEKIALLYFGDKQTDRQTDRQTNRWTGPLHEAALAVVSGGLISVAYFFGLW